MTRKFQRQIRCPSCAYEFPVEESWRQWVRNCSGLHSQDYDLHITDIDMSIERYAVRTGRLRSRLVRYHQVVEVKTRGGMPDRHQLENLCLLDRAIRTVDRTQRDLSGRFSQGHRPNFRVLDKSSMVLDYGVHVWRMSGLTPQDSDWMTWASVANSQLMNERRINVETLVRVLRFDVNPDTLLPLEHRAHKRTPVPILSLLEAGHGVKAERGMGNVVRW